MRDKRGFTLIELLVVIAIIGIIASVVLVSVNSAREKARDSRRKADLNQLLLGIQMYADDNNGKYPGETWCDSSIGSRAGAGCPPAPPQNDWDYNSTFVKAVDDYVSTLPIDPINNTTYYYNYEPHCNQQNCPNPKGCCYYYLRARLEQGGSFILEGY